MVCIPSNRTFLYNQYTTLQVRKSILVHYPPSTDSINILPVVPVMSLFPFFRSRSLSRNMCSRLVACLLRLLQSGTVHQSLPFFCVLDIFEVLSEVCVCLFLHDNSHVTLDPLITEMLLFSSQYVLDTKASDVCLPHYP